MTMRSTDSERDPITARRKRTEALAAKFERETWGLPREQRGEAHRLTTAEADLMTVAARFDGLEVRSPGSVVARLVEIGFIEITQGDARRSIARLTHAGALALICRLATKYEAMKPKRARAA